MNTEPTTPEPEDDWQADGQQSADALGLVLAVGFFVMAVAVAVATVAWVVGWLR